MNSRTVLILGAGINGAAIARELLLNRVPVLLVDSADLASGATSYSTRLVHGGLRYLEYGEFRLVRESLSERTRLLELAPDFVQPLRLFIPVNRLVRGWAQAAQRFLGLPDRGRVPTSRGRWLIGTGLWMYDTLAHGTTLPGRSLHPAGSRGTPRVAPKYQWMYAFYDAQMAFPERFVAALLHDAEQIAAEQGVPFEVLTYHRAEVRGATVEIRGERARTVEPSAIINATGSWVDESLGTLPVRSKRRLMGGTKGSHLVTFHPELHAALAGCGLYVEADDGRPIFIVPWNRSVLIGTTDVPFAGDPASATVSEEEIEYLLNSVNQVLPWLKLCRDDIALHYAGVRPLPYVDQSSPAAITRRHWIETHPGEVPLFSVIGGKLTTCRSLAEQAAETVMARWGEKPAANSRDRPIPGASGAGGRIADTSLKQRSLANQSGFDVGQIESIWNLAAESLEQTLNAVGTPAAVERMSLAGTRIPRQYARQVLKREWVTRLADLVERRLMLIYEAGLSADCLRELAQLMAEEGKLSSSDVDSEVDQCRQRLLAHYGRRLS